MSAPVLTVFEHQVVGIGLQAGHLSESEVEDLLAVARARPGFCTRGHRSVQFSQYAGLARAGQRIVEILPKVGDDVEPAAARSTLLRLLRLAGRLPVHTLENVGQRLQHASLLDVFIAAFQDAVACVVSRGLSRHYRETEDDLAVVRSRILVQRQVAVNALRPDRIACRFDDFDLDHPLNQVLKSALELVHPLTVGRPLGRQWREVYGAFADVASPRGPQLPMRSLASDRRFSHYRDALRWAEWILQLLSPRLRAGTGDAPALVFDMNRLFESAVATILDRRARSRGQRLDVQHSGRYMLEACDAAGTNHQRVRPDLVISERGEVVAVADTKWVRMPLDGHRRVLPHEAHVYQMHAYATLYACDHVVLIYPWHEGLARMRPSRYELPARDGRRSQLHVHCVDVASEGLPWKGPWTDSPLRRDSSVGEVRESVPAIAR